MTLSKNKQIGSMFFVVFVVLVTFSIPNANANANTISSDEQKIYDVEVECKQQIRSDDSLTFAQKLVNVKACGIESRLALQELIVATESSSVQILQHQVRDCEAKYLIFKMIGENTFLNLERSTLARHCVMLYELDEWKIQDDTRMDSLVDGLINTLQEELDKDIELRKSIVHKNLERYHNQLMNYG